MVLQFQPWDVPRRQEEPDKYERFDQGIQSALQTWLQYKQQQQQQDMLRQGLALKTAENARQEAELGIKQQDMAMKKREPFYNYGDPSGLTSEEQAYIQPTQGPQQEGQTGPIAPAYDPHNPAQFPMEFKSKFPLGVKGAPNEKYLFVHHDKADSHNAGGSAKPQLRMNQFTGEYEWYLPPNEENQDQQARVIPGSGAREHGPGTFKDVSKSAGDYSESKTLTDNVISEINRAMELNKNSRGGVLGEALQRGQSALNMGTDSPEFKNTADVINTLKSQVARVLKSTFGGQLSDSERAYLNEVYGAAERMSPQEREIAMKNVITTLQGKAAASGAKYGALSGTAPVGGGLQAQGGFDQAKRSRLEELRAKRAAGTLR